MNRKHEEEIRQIFADCRAVVTDDHFVYTAGDHGSAYVNKNAISPYPTKLKRLCDLLAEQTQSASADPLPFRIDAVVAPAVGGIAPLQHVALKLSEFCSKEVLAIFAEKTDDGSFVIGRGQASLVTGKRVVVLEDIINSATSIKELIACVRSIDCDISAAAALCNRGGITAKDLQVPELHALLDFSLDKWPAGECPLCKKGMPINTELGHGKKFLAEQETT